jgi:hypothetical protein
MMTGDTTILCFVVTMYNGKKERKERKEMPLSDATLDSMSVDNMFVCGLS